MQIHLNQSSPVFAHTNRKPQEERKKVKKQTLHYDVQLDLTVTPQAWNITLSTLQTMAKSSLSQQYYTFPSRLWWGTLNGESNSPSCNRTHRSCLILDLVKGFFFPLHVCYASFFSLCLILFLPENFPQSPALCTSTNFHGPPFSLSLLLI